MQKASLKSAEYSRFRAHRGVKLPGWMWTGALVLIIVAALGGIMGCRGQPPSKTAAGKKAEVRTPVEATCLSQREEFPTGCESVTAVMALNYAGVDISAGDFVDLYLPKGSAPHPAEEGGGINAEAKLFCGDPELCFLGDPRSEDGWGCYAPAIESALLAVLEEYDSQLEVVNLCGQSLEELAEEYIAKGTPVMVWATQGMAEPVRGETLTVEGSGRQFDWIRPEHCLLLVGEREDEYLFNDPLERETVAYDKKAAQRAYEALGSQALAIE